MIRKFKKHEKGKQMKRFDLCVIMHFDIIMVSRQEKKQINVKI